MSEGIREDSFPNVKERAQEKGFNFPYLFDESREVPHACGARYTWDVFLVDGAGILQYHGAIDDHYDNPNAVKKHYLHDTLEAILAGETPPIPKRHRWDV
jgi:hypothetical protein